MMRYRLLVSLVAGMVLIRHGRGRLLAPPAPADAPPRVWLHGASNGELASVRPILMQLIAARPDLGWLVTSNTESARDMVRAWSLPGVEAEVAPVDLRRLSRKVMQDWRIVAHITLEAELWPHRVMTCKGPVLWLGARMSAATARGWARLGTLAGRVVKRIGWVSPQDEASRDRMLKLGLPEAAMGPVVDLKAFYDAPGVEAPEGLIRESCWLAASTHDGEEQTVLQAHRAARQREPDLRLVLAPRHPRRAPEIRAMIEAAGLSAGQRSRGDRPEVGDVYLADTMGEMPLWYAGCGRVFVAGSLTDRGGHTPYEPAAFGAALIHGPDLRNFRAAYDRLEAASAALCITDAEELAKALNALRSRQQAAGQAARIALRPETDLKTVCDLLLQKLPNA
ncbi:3-deoxy-D-manno-octulosonic acid transferase [Sagittula salina]|uniref:3-deoxy-D-manno-octulosonic acid transferase n=1 Tax=Sagittula salina TaxID=2820268 RepID=A0A940ML12_9RHOB|nr:glycosyltransferase N-terminal domain-containing protein [Sagittula salina]MBP0481299.1 3-deoxy-D-manno-octulosonic acid transferase [Sagittula salina]